MVYETYGTLNADRSNAVLICHALSGDHHVAGYYDEDDPGKPGWWDNCIGPGKPIDTRAFFVVCCNNLGGCKGSTGPTAINPENRKPYGPDFPIVTVRTGCAARRGWPTGSASRNGRRSSAAASAGCRPCSGRSRSPTGCGIRWSSPPRPGCPPRTSPSTKWRGRRSCPILIFTTATTTNSASCPGAGLMLARMLGHITYLSDEGMRAKFGRELR